MVNKLPMPFNNPRTYTGHSGVDYGQPEGTPFRASDSGIVTGRGHNKRGGFYIWVRYDSITHLVGYHHLPSHDGTLTPGTRFNKGDRLGYVGNTGNSTGPHLHSEVAGFATTEGYWKFFDKSRVVTIDTEPSKSETDEDDEMIVFIQGKAGVRNGGLYLLKDGKRTFLGNPSKRSHGFGIITDDAIINKLFAIYK